MTGIDNNLAVLESSTHLLLVRFSEDDKEHKNIGMGERKCLKEVGKKFYENSPTVKHNFKTQ